MSQLFSPLKLRGIELANRIMVAPMCQYVAIDGQATLWHLVHLGQLSLSGAGMLCLEATAVEARGRITPGDLGLYDDATEAALLPIVTALHAFSNTAIMMQLAHAGRKASSHTPWEGGQEISPAAGGWLTDAPSALPQSEGDTVPLALDKAGLQRIRDAFVDTAKRAVRLGIDGFELHAAHGYLLHQFLSPISNQRSDGYGGALENRLRFPLEVFDAVRAAVPAGMPIGVKVSATDWVDGGWDLEQTLAFARALETRGVDWIDVSSGGISPAQKIPVGPGYQVPFAAALKKAVRTPIVAVGLITDPHQAEQIISSGEADLIALARGMLWDPRWAWHAAAALNAQVSAPPSYWRAPPHQFKDVFSGAAFGQR